jgi:hypothetical protein
VRDYQKPPLSFGAVLKLGHFKGFHALNYNLLKMIIGHLWLRDLLEVSRYIN